MKRIFKPMAAILSMILILTLLGGCDAKERATLIDGRRYYCYEQLDDSQKDIYLGILDNLSAGEDSILLLDVSFNRFEKVFTALLDDHPELFWLSGVYTYYEGDILGVDYLLIEPEFYVEKEELSQYRDKFDLKVKEIKESASLLESDYEKVLFVHDYIANNTEYNYELSEEIISEDGVNHLDAYNCLVEGTAVCQGYTDVFEIIMNELGIPCGSVLGKSKIEDGEQTGDTYHIWNFIELEGENYYIDVTWADPHPEEKENFDICYEYFCIDTEELEITHEISQEENIFVPLCNGKKYNYFRQNEMFAENYNFSLASQIISKQIENDAVFIKFSSAEELKRAEKQLFDNEKIFNIKAVYNAVDSVSYTTGYSGRLLYIFPEK